MPVAGKKKKPPNALSARQKAQLVRDYIELGSYAAAARKNGVHWNTVRNACKEDRHLEEKLQKKKQACARDLLSHMEQKNGEVCDIIDRITEEFMKPERIADTSTRDLATVMGILLDKQMKVLELRKQERMQAAGGVQITMGGDLERFAK